MPYAKQAEAVLAAWRVIRREIERLGPDTTEAKLLAVEAGRLRAEYGRLTDAAREARRPEPPPWPDDQGLDPAPD